jgi:hypothetical protein
MNMNIVTIILTSAVVSAAVTSMFSLLGQRLDRKARHKEMLFTKSVELAKMKADFLVQYSKDTSNAAAIHDYVAYAEQYYWLLERLHNDGRLPDNWRDEIAKRFPLENAEQRRY